MKPIEIVNEKNQHNYHNCDNYQTPKRLVPPQLDADLAEPPHLGRHSLLQEHHAGSSL